ncbi:hypothetical protein HFO21_25930 [Rhizobium laguerreae]|uniref:hypothetical protein n=1 Tax=Rhizobium laguerreae TaxID=1076926 RepID=UPI001C926261|nr:hypothetical protein [Rhizobium laguerreae]MBY3217753.1 hypothetical protein [Rhizobium laguerreae]
MTHSWTTEQDMPSSGRLRIIAYSPKKGVEWSARWQDTQEEPLEKVISTIVETLQASHDHILKLMIAEDAAEARRKKSGQKNGSATSDERTLEKSRRLSQTAGSSLPKPLRNGERRWL